MTDNGPENRPLFDDEDLPAWLKQAGISYAGQQAGAEAEDWLAQADDSAPVGGSAPMPWDNAPTAGQSASEDDLSWLEEEVTPKYGTAIAPKSDAPDLPRTGELPWMSGAAEPMDEAAGAARPGVTGMLPWRQGVDSGEAATAAAGAAPETSAVPWSAGGETSPAAETPFAGDTDDALIADWQKIAEQQPNASARPGVTSFLPWRQGGSETPPETLAPPSEQALPTEEADLDWLKSAPEAEETPLTAVEGDPNWLGSFMTGEAQPERSPAQATPTAGEDDWMAAISTPADGDTTDDLFGEPPAVNEAQTWLPSFSPEPEPKTPETQAKEPEESKAGKVDTQTINAWLSTTDEGAEAQPAVPASDLSGWLDAQPPEAPADQPADDDWLKDFQVEAPAQPKAEAAAPAADVPDWFKDAEKLPEPGDEAQAPAADLEWLAEVDAQLATAEDLPDWVTGKETPMAGEPAASSPAVRNDTGELPEWMRDLAPVAPTPIAAPESAPLSSLEWLEDVDLPAEGKPPAQAAQTDDDLARLFTASAPVPDDVESASIDSIDIDALLSLPASGALAPRPEPELEPELPPIVSLEEQTQTLDLTEELDLDELLGPAPVVQETPPAPAPASTPRVTARTAEPPPDTGTPGVVLPEWVADLRPAEVPVVLSIGNKEIRIPETPIAKLSDQVRQLRERVKQFQARPPVGRTAPKAGPLTGITGVIEPISEVIKPQPTISVFDAVVSDMQARRVRQLKSILSIQDEILERRQRREGAHEEQEAAARPSAAARTRARPKLDRILIALFLALIIVTPFFTDALNIAVLPTAETLSTAARAQFEAVTRAVDSLQAGQYALVAFEYGPTGAGEMDDMARALLRDLFKRGVRPVVVSTNPSGALHAQGLLTRMAANADELQFAGRETLTAGRDYVVLRYLPGGAAGVRAVVAALGAADFQRQVLFETDIEGRPANLDGTAIAYLRANPAFVVSETPDDVRNWVEQYQATQADQAYRIVLLASAAAAPTAQTYAQSALDATAPIAEARVVGPLVSLRDTLIYQTVRGQYTTAQMQKTAGQRWQSVSIGTLFSAVLILFGTGINLLRGLRRRRR